jgi:hypothetical protein
VSRADDWAERAEAIGAARERRKELVVGRETLVASITDLLFDCDPVGLNFVSNRDEYQAEAECIVIRLSEAREQADVTRIVHAEFVAWFDSDLAGPSSRYEEIARQIWLWRRRERH